jgi:hypothetical protein
MRLLKKLREDGDWYPLRSVLMEFFPEIASQYVKPAFEPIVNGKHRQGLFIEKEAGALNR